MALQKKIDIMAKKSNRRAKQINFPAVYLTIDVVDTFDQYTLLHFRETPAAYV